MEFVFKRMEWISPLLQIVSIVVYCILDFWMDSKATFNTMGQWGPDMGKYNKTLHYNNQQSKLYWVEAPYNNFWCWLFWGTLHTTFKNVVVGLVLVGTKNYNFVK